MWRLLFPRGTENMNALVVTSKSGSVPLLQLKVLWVLSLLLSVPDVKWHKVNAIMKHSEVSACGEQCRKTAARNVDINICLSLATKTLQFYNMSAGRGMSDRSEIKQRTDWVNLWERESWGCRLILQTLSTYQRIWKHSVCAPDIYMFRCSFVIFTSCDNRYCFQFVSLSGKMWSWWHLLYREPPQKRFWVF